MLRMPNKNQEATPDWGRLQNETEEAFEAFVLYRDMPVPRTQAAVAEQLGKSRSLISRWSAKHQWVRRADAADRARTVLANSGGTEGRTVEQELQETLRIQLRVQQTLTGEFLRRVEHDPSSLSDLPEEELSRRIAQAGTELGKTSTLKNVVPSDAVRAECLNEELVKLDNKELAEIVQRGLRKMLEFSKEGRASADAPATSILEGIGSPRLSGIAERSAT